MSENTRVLVSTSSDTVSNLALEEALLNRVVSGEEILLLYENSTSVVIGRFQNPWKECHTGLARRLGIPVYRRVSGGGTVVHGTGNLNYSIISGLRIPAKEDNLDRVIKALNSLGAAVFRNERYDLRVHPSGFPDRQDGLGLKVSGSAFRQTSSASMHHATLLVNAGLETLKELLHQRSRDMTVKGVASVSSPVINLAHLVPDLDIPAVIAALGNVWLSEPESIGPEDFVDDRVFLEARTRLMSPEWIWEKTPAFTERFTNLPGYYDKSMELDIKAGRISQTPSGASFLLNSSYNGPDIEASGAPETPAWLASLASRVDGDD